MFLPLSSIRLSIYSILELCSTRYCRDAHLRVNWQSHSQPATPMLVTLNELSIVLPIMPQ